MIGMLSGSCTVYNRWICFGTVSKIVGSTKPGHRDDAVLSLLRELVRIETPTGDAEASEHVADVLEAQLTALGGAVRRVSIGVGVNLAADFAGVGDPVLLVGHTDTVWPVGTLDGDVPWSVDGDVVRGPGAFDMKAGIVVMLEALRRTDAAHRRACRIVLVCDEEVGSPGSRGFLEAEAAGSSAAIGFESPHPDGALKVGRRGSTRLRIRVAGRAAHAALDPERGVSAVDELVDQLVRVRAVVADPTLPTPVLCNAGTVAGGGRANVVPDAAEAELGLRFVDPVTESTVLDALGSLAPVRADARVETEILSRRPAWRASEADERFAARLTEIAARLGQQLGGRPAAGAGDTNQIGNLGLPTVDGFGPRGGGAHAVDEHLLLSSLHERIDLLTAFLTEDD